MPAVARGVIPADWTTLRVAYPFSNRLPKHIADHMAELNKDIPPGEKKHTSCCYQISEALNRAGAEHRIGAYSFRRNAPKSKLNGRNAFLNGAYYLGAVDELENHLTARYGAGEALHEGAGTKDRVAAMKAKIAGRQGIVCFRDNGSGSHAELWDGSATVQHAHEANWLNPRIVFWPFGGEDDQAEAPVWLQGWWDVWDGSAYWYHVSAQFIVRWTEAEPTGPNALPPTADGGNEGKAALSGTALTVTWAPRSGGTTVETFLGVTAGVPVWPGISNRWGPLTMTRKTTWRR